MKPKIQLKIIFPKFLFPASWFQLIFSNTYIYSNQPLNKLRKKIIKRLILNIFFFRRYCIYQGANEHDVQFITPVILRLHARRKSPGKDGVGHVSTVSAGGGIFGAIRQVIGCWLESEKLPLLKDWGYRMSKS